MPAIFCRRGGILLPTRGCRPHCALGWATLPQTLRFSYGKRTFRVVHGGVNEVSRWVFASDGSTLAEELAHTAEDITIAGHCGLPFIASIGRRTWFNPGVIGMPANDGTAHVWYGLIETRDGDVSLSTHRLSYDHVAASAVMRRFGYANGYARSLVTGLWPSLDILPSVERSLTGKRLRARSVLIKESRLGSRKSDPVTIHP